MPLHRHEIPTHLNVEDRAFYGLSARQAAFLILGLSGAYALWNGWPHLPTALRIALATTCLALSAALALLRAQGRGIEEWLFVALRYLTVPKAAVWRPTESSESEPHPSTGRWAEMEPRVDWKEVR